MNLEQAMAFHLDRMRGARRADSTLRMYRSYWTRFLDYLRLHELPLELTMLNEAVVGEFMEDLVQQSLGRRGGEVAHRQGVLVLRIISKWLWRHHILASDQLAIMDIPTVEIQLREPYTDEEARRLLSAAGRGRNGIRDRAVLLLLFDSGCRIGELCGLDLDDVLDASGHLTGSIHIRHAKNHHARQVIVQVHGARDGGPTLKALRAWLKVRHPRPGVGALFVLDSGWRFEPDDARALFRRLGQDTGIRQCIPHRTRHTAASELYAERPKDDTGITDRLGHLDPRSKRAYIQINDRGKLAVAADASLSTKWKL